MRIYFTILEKEKNTDMLSELKLTILENNKLDFVKAKLSDTDKLRIQGWFTQQIGLDKMHKDFDDILDIFLWCCTEGEYAADTQNPQIFARVFGKKASESEISVSDLSSLFFSHSSLFESISEEPDKVQEKSLHGKLIVFEGLDGSGKSTQIQLLAEKLKLIGRKVYCTAEPTNSATGGLIRDTLSNNYKRDAAELAGLFLTDRIAHNVNPVWGIKKFIDDGIDVICDRYYYSSFAYQGLGTSLSWVMDMNLNCPEIIKPDLCIFLDVDYKKCKARVDEERPHLEIFESDESIMEATRTQFYEVFKLLNQTEHIQIIDANRSINTVADEIYRIVVALDGKC